MSQPQPPNDKPSTPPHLGQPETEFDAFIDRTLDPAIVELDPLAQQYRERITDPSRPRRSVAHHHAALLCIDIQYLDAARNIGVFAPDRPEAAPPEAQNYYFERLERVVLPNVSALQASFRATGLEVIHSRIQSLTLDGRDRSAGHKRLDLHAAPGSKEAEFLPEVAPRGDEIVINKTASGIFTSTNARYLLANLEITALYVVGVYTNECVSTTVRDACDLGFDVTLIDDGCATVSRRLQRNTIAVLRDRYARIMTTTQVLAELRRVTRVADSPQPG